MAVKKSRVWCMLCRTVCHSLKAHFSVFKHNSFFLWSVFFSVISAPPSIILPLFSAANTVWWELRWLDEVHCMGVIGWVLGIGSHKSGSLSRGQLVTGEVPNIPGTHLPFIAIQLLWFELKVCTSGGTTKSDESHTWTPPYSGNSGPLLVKSVSDKPFTLVVTELYGSWNSWYPFL